MKKRVIVKYFLYTYLIYAHMFTIRVRSITSEGVQHFVGVSQYLLMMCCFSHVAISINIICSFNMIRLGICTAIWICVNCVSLYKHTQTIAVDYRNRAAV